MAQVATTDLFDHRTRTTAVVVWVKTTSDFRIVPSVSQPRFSALGLVLCRSQVPTSQREMMGLQVA